MIDDQFNEPLFTPPPAIAPAEPNPLDQRGDDPAAIWRGRRELLGNTVQPTIETDDYKEACADAIEWVLPDLTLITLDQAQALSNHYALEAL